MHGTKKVGLQLFSVRTEYQSDLAGTLERVARMGYDGVEFFGAFPRPADELRRLLEGIGLEAAGYHVLLPALEGDALRETIAYMTELRTKHVTLAVVPEARRQTKQDWLDAATLLRAAADEFARNGLTLGYHNHRMEFEPVEGELPFDLLFENLPPSVTMQLDCGHALRAGADPASLLRKYPGRSRTIHIRDWSRTNESALVGEGEVNWVEVLRLCRETADTEWYIVEQGDAGIPPFEAAEKDLRNLEVLFDRAAGGSL
jgi:sugar phosphate isomerase/epimerase